MTNYSRFFGGVADGAVTNPKQFYAVVLVLCIWCERYSVYVNDGESNFILTEVYESYQWSKRQKKRYERAYFVVMDQKLEMTEYGNIPCLAYVGEGPPLL